MLDPAKLSTRYCVRTLDDADADAILGLCLENTQYYDYCGKQPTRELILNDLHITPPDTPSSSKYYVGFFDDDRLVAVMDLIVGYPESDIAFIGFFMTRRSLQGRGMGSAIIDEVFGCLAKLGMTSVMLGIDKGNPQSLHFWKKNGFSAIREVDREDGTIVVAQKIL